MEYDYQLPVTLYSPERQLSRALSVEADEILEDFGVRLEEPEDIARLMELYDLDEDDVIEKRAISPMTDESIVRIRCASGTVVYRHDRYWHDLYRPTQDIYERHRKAFTEGSHVSMWAEDGGDLLTTVLTYHYNYRDGAYADSPEDHGLTTEEKRLKDVGRMEYLLGHLHRGNMSLADLVHEEAEKTRTERVRGRAGGDGSTGYVEPETDNPYEGSKGFRAYMHSPGYDDPERIARLSPERHLSGFRTHERLGRTAVAMGFEITN